MEKFILRKGRCFDESWRYYEMTRPIRFRGKRKDNGEWVYGDLMSDGRSYWIVGPVVDASEEYISPEWWAPIIKETLGQFTGLLDREGKEIWEGDIVECQNSIGHKGKGKIEYNDGCFDVYFEKSFWDYRNNPSTFKTWITRDYVKCFVGNHVIEILGNIYDNPELTK